MRVSYMARTEALPVLKAVDPADLLLEVLARGVRVMPPSNLLTKKSTCPHCGIIGVVSKDFGVRVLGGTVRPQSWCRECRKNPDRMSAKKRTTDGKKFPTTKQELMELLKKNLSASQMKALKNIQMGALKGVSFK